MLQANAVFEGGGIRGIGIVGALSYLENYGYSWRKVAGSSVGALIATLISAGYSAKELKKILINTNFQKFMDKDPLQRIPLLGKPLSFLVQNSIYSGNYLENWINDLLYKKNIVTFGDLWKRNNFPLKIIASDITRCCTIVLPDDLPYYNINPSKFPISKAIRMSISIPFYFKPVKLSYSGGTSYILDGCISCNYPINIFDDDPYPTLGFKFKDRQVSYTATGRTDTLSMLFDIAKTMCHKTTAENLSEKNLARSIVIPTADVETTDFDISKEKSIQLFKYGYRSAMNFIKERH